MPSVPTVPRSSKLRYLRSLAMWVVLLSVFLPCLRFGPGLANAQEGSRPRQFPVPPPANPKAPMPPDQQAQTPPAQYDKGIFQNPIPGDQLRDLKRFAGVKSNNLIEDKQFRQLWKGVIPDCLFHYGRDMSLHDALELVIKGSQVPVQIRDDRYLTISGQNGPYLSGRGFLWIDLEDGIALGAFYFRPTNGEPTPSVNVFSRQVKEDSLGLSQLPPAFVEEFGRWSRASKLPVITTRYFITGANKKNLLEHDENYCAAADGSAAPPEKWCEQMSADAADIDLNAAYYLELTHHATNATAWMITGQDQSAWLQLRDYSCRGYADPLGCHIWMTRQRVHVIIQRPVPPHPVHG